MHQLQQSLQAAGVLLVEHVLELETDEGSEDAAGKSLCTMLPGTPYLASDVDQICPLISALFLRAGCPRQSDNTQMHLPCRSVLPKTDTTLACSVIPA